MFVFHLTDDHNGLTCLEMVRYIQMEANKETVEESLKGEGTPGVDGDYVNYFLEYESDSERGDDILITLQEPSHTV